MCLTDDANSYLSSSLWNDTQSLRSCSRKSGGKSEWRHVCLLSRLLGWWWGKWNWHKRWWRWPYRHLSFCFRITNKFSKQPCWRQRRKKILSHSKHEASELQNSNTKSLDSLTFFLNKFIAKRHPESLPKIRNLWHRYLQIYHLCIWK